MSERQSPLDTPTLVTFSDERVEPAIRPALQRFVELLVEWNRVYNLVGPGASPAIWTHHVLDSLSVTSLIEGARVADIGSGAGFPGLVLAIAFPARSFVLFDANGKKARFLAHAKRQLGLDNIEIVNARVEETRASSRPSFGTLITRALGTIAYFLEVSSPLAGPGTQWLAMKGRIPREEIESLPRGYRLEKLWRIRIAEVLAERHVVDLRLTDAAHQEPVSQRTSPYG